jgi:hypothetical protein
VGGQGADNKTDGVSAEKEKETEEEKEEEESMATRHLRGAEEPSSFLLIEGIERDHSRLSCLLSPP